MSPRKRLVAATTKPGRSRVQTVQLCDKLAWSRALKLAGGDASRLSVLSWTSVLVSRPRHEDSV